MIKNAIIAGLVVALLCKWSAEAMLPPQFANIPNQIIQLKAQLDRIENTVNWIAAQRKH